MTYPGTSQDRAISGGWNEGLNEDNESITDTSRLLRQQSPEEMMTEQQNGLERLHDAVRRQKLMAHGIATEVDIHNELLDEVESGMTRAQDHLRRNTKNVQLINRKTSTCFYWLVIIMLMVVIIVLAVI